MAVEKLSVVLELVSGNYKREAKEAADATGRIGGAATSVTGSLGRMIGPAAIGGAIVGLVNLAQKAGENADRLFDLATQTGLSTDALQEWEFVTAAAGAKSDTFADAVKQVIKNMDQAVISTSTVARAYDVLGVSVLDANGQIRDGGTITEEVFEKLAAMENITARNALAQDLFGKKWEETITILDLGGEALADLREEGKQAVVSPEALRNADKFRETMDKLKAILGAQLNRAIGAIAPFLTDVAEAAREVMDELEPLLEGLGWLSERFGDAREAGNEMAQSTNPLIAGWGRMIEEVGILNVLTGNYSGVIEAAITPTYEAAAAAIYMADASKDDLIPAMETTTTVVGEQAVAFNNAAAAADNQRTAMINLANFQASQLSPIGNIIRLQQDLVAAQETLTEAQKDSKTPADELALAQLGVAEAMLAVQGAGLALEPDQIQAFAQLLITQFGYSEQAALDTLAALNLLDGWTGTATFTLEMDKVVSGPGAVGNINTDLVGFAGGGTVPGWPGQPQLVLAHGGETITPAGQTTNSNSRVQNNYFAAPVKPVDLQWLSLMSNLETLVS